MAITYEETSDQGIHERVRQKHQAAIQELKRLHFQEYSFFGETVQLFGFIPLGLAGIFGTIVALFSEAARVKGNLDVTIFNVVMASRENATYAAPFGLGVKFYTRFTDGTCLISANFESPTIQDDKEKLYKFAVPRTILSAVMDHEKRVQKFVSEGKEKDEHLSFAGFLKLTQQEDTYLLKIKNKVIAGDLFSTVISAILSMSLLVGITYFFLFLAGFVQSIFPSCLIVSDKSSTLQRSFISFGCIFLSWILARFQKNMLTVNGAGTKLLGQTPISDASGFVSTKWLVLIIPLLPVRSYRVTGVFSDGQTRQIYSMEPLQNLEWMQIKETIWKWKWAYLVVLCIFTGLIMLLVIKCI